MYPAKASLKATCPGGASAKHAALLDCWGGWSTCPVAHALAALWTLAYVGVVHAFWTESGCGSELLSRELDRLGEGDPVSSHATELAIPRRRQSVVPAQYCISGLILKCLQVGFSTTHDLQLSRPSHPRPELYHGPAKWHCPHLLRLVRGSEQASDSAVQAKVLEKTPSSYH